MQPQETDIISSALQQVVFYRIINFVEKPFHKEHFFGKPYIKDGNKNSSRFVNTTAGASPFTHRILVISVYLPGLFCMQMKKPNLHWFKFPKSISCQKEVKIQGQNQLWLPLDPGAHCCLQRSLAQLSCLFPCQAASLQQIQPYLPEPPSLAERCFSSYIIH